MRREFRNLLVSINIVLLLNFNAFAKNRGLIIFVHGFMGDEIGTWKNDKTENVWPNLFNDDSELKALKLDSFSYGYKSNVLEKDMNIRELSRRMGDTISKISKGYGDIYFVAHSLGGILSLDCLAANKKGDIFKKTKAIFLLATPFRGAETYAIKHLTPNPLILDLSIQARTSALNQLDDSWRDILNERRDSDKPLVFACYERRPILELMPDNLLVVDPNSIFPTRKTTQIAMEEDHFTIAKPSDSSSYVYQWVRGHILDLAQKNDARQSISISCAPEMAGPHTSLKCTAINSGDVIQNNVNIGFIRPLPTNTIIDASPLYGINIEQNQQQPRVYNAIHDKDIFFIVNIPRVPPKSQISFILRTTHPDNIRAGEHIAYLKTIAESFIESFKRELAKKYPGDAGRLDTGKAKRYWTTYLNYYYPFNYFYDEGTFDVSYCPKAIEEHYDQFVKAVHKHKPEFAEIFSKRKTYLAPIVRIDALGEPRTYPLKMPFTLYDVYFGSNISSNSMTPYPLVPKTYLEQFSITLFDQQDYLYLINRALMYLQQQDYEKAEQVQLQIIKINPNDATALTNLANIFSGRGKNEIAIEYYRRAIFANPYLIKPLTQLIFHLNNSAKDDEIIKLFDALRQKYPENPGINIQYAKYQASKGRNKKAIKTFLHIIEINNPIYLCEALWLTTHSLLRSPNKGALKKIEESIVRMNLDQLSVLDAKYLLDTFKNMEILFAKNALKVQQYKDLREKISATHLAK